MTTQYVRAPRNDTPQWAEMIIRPQSEMGKGTKNITDEDANGNKLMSINRDNDPDFVAEEQWCIAVFFEWDRPTLQWASLKYYFNKSERTPKVGKYNVLVQNTGVKNDQNGNPLSGDYDNQYNYDILDWGSDWEEGTTSFGTRTEKAGDDSLDLVPQRPNNIEGDKKKTEPGKRFPRSNDDPMLGRRIIRSACQHDASEIVAGLLEEFVISCRPPDNLSIPIKIEMYSNSLESEALPYISKLIARLTDSLYESWESTELLP